MNYNLIKTSDSISKLIVDGSRPVTVIGNDYIRGTIDETVVEQVKNVINSPGIENLVLGPDANPGYGCPVGSVFTSSTHIYPCSVGPDISCSMSFMTYDIDKDQIKSKEVRRKLISEICKRIPTGCNSRQAEKAPRIEKRLLESIVCEGASDYVLAQLGIPKEYNQFCEQSINGEYVDNRSRLIDLLDAPKSKIFEKLTQIGSLGSGNHFLECDFVSINPDNKFIADHFGIKDGQVGIMVHCGSRGFGYQLASNQFKTLEEFFKTWSIPLPGNEKEMVYAPLETPQAQTYLTDMALGANFAVVNHLLIQKLVNDAFIEVLGQIKSNFVYYVSHNIIRKEIVNNKPTYVHRKGATRAFGAGHFALKNTPFYSTGHPVLLPGNSRDGSIIAVGTSGNDISINSVNHGAGRVLGRKAAIRSLDQSAIDKEFDELDILSNHRQYPKDEAPAVYKDFKEVISSVESAQLASVVAKLTPTFVIKDADSQSKEG